MSTTAPETPPASPATPGELAQIEALKRPAQATEVKWPVDGMALLALDYLAEADRAANARINTMVTKERAEATERFSEWVERLVGRRPPLLPGHDLVTMEIEGKTYLVAVPLESA